MQQGNRYLLLPDDYLAVYSLALVDQTTGEYNYLLFKDANLIREMYPNPSVTGTPRVFGQFGPTSAIVGPSPNKTYTAELHYFYYPDSIVSAGSSWVGTNFSSVLLYGTIAEGYRYLKGDAVQQKTYDDQYKEALNLLRKLGEGVTREDAYTTVPVKTNVIVGE